MSYITDVLNTYSYFSNSSTVPENWFNIEQTSNTIDVCHDKPLDSVDFVKISTLSDSFLNQEIYLPSLLNNNSEEKYDIKSISIENNISKIICSKELNVDDINKFKLLKHITLVEIQKKIKSTKCQFRPFIVYDLKVVEKIKQENNYYYVLGHDVYQN